MPDLESLIQYLQAAGSSLPYQFSLIPNPSSYGQLLSQGKVQGNSSEMWVGVLDSTFRV